MILQSLRYPFDHTIIYDVFDDDQVTSIINEAVEIASKYDKDGALGLLDPNDFHDKQIIEKYKTKIFEIDKTASEGVIRNLCWNVPKLFFSNVLEKTQLTNYFHTLSTDKIYFQFYNNGSSYPSHRDYSTISIVYVFYKNPSAEIEGGKFKFTEFDYEPYMKHNSCILFPGWAMHEVSELKCDPNNNRISFFQQFSI